jgi:ferredoxin
MKITIDGREIITDGGTILQAAQNNGINIPTLCYLAHVNEIAACRMCIVEIEGMPGVKTACTTKVSDGMIIHTNTPQIQKMRRCTLELICKNHTMACTECGAGMDCKLREFCKEYGVDDERYNKGYRKKITDTSSVHLVRDNSKCILCRRCVSVCNNVQGIGAISVTERSNDSKVGFALPLNQTKCTNCGQCISVCPTGALQVHDDTQSAWKTILARKRTAMPVAIVSPNVCRQVGFLFGDNIEGDNSGKVATMLRKIGFWKVYICPTDAGICPAWIKHLKQNSELAQEIPQNYQTSWDKFAYKIRNAHKEELKITAFTTCTAVRACEDSPIDVQLTTRELGTMWKRACVSNFTAVTEWENLQDEKYDLITWDEEVEATHEYIYGIANADKLLKEGQLKNPMNVYACPGGCLYGGGSPRKYISQLK